MTGGQKVTAAETKGALVVIFILASGLLIAGACAGISSYSDAAGTPPGTQCRLDGTCPAVGLRIADRVETQDRVTYGTDPSAERSMEEQERLEKEREERSWQMLQNMNIYKGGKKSSDSTKSDSSTQK